MTLSTKAAHAKDVGKIADMQHRHFATIATIIRRLDYSSLVEGATLRQDVAEHFAGALARTNPRFDRDRFLRACKP